MCFFCNVDDMCIIDFCDLGCYCVDGFCGVRDYDSFVCFCLIYIVYVEIGGYVCCDF